MMMSKKENRLKKVQSLANWLDRRYAIPFTRLRIGMDGIIGLIPWIGDTLTLILSSWIVYQAYQMEAPFRVKLHMVWNIFVDWLVGLIPFFGDLFDIGWQANQKNAQLLADHLREQAGDHSTPPLI